MNPLWLLVGAGVAVGAMTQSATGIGFSLICAPILVVVAGAPDAVRLAVVVSLPLNLSVLAWRWRCVIWPAAIQLFLPAAAVAWVLAAVTRGADTRVIAVVAGISVLCSVATRACGRRARWLGKPIGTVFTGAASGAMNVAGSTAGPVAALYASNAGWSATRATATLQAYFAALNVVTLLTLGLPRHTVLLVPAFAGLVLGLAAGLPLGSRIPTPAAHRIVLALAAAGGLAIITQAAL